MFINNTEPGEWLFSTKSQRTLVSCALLAVVVFIIVLTFFSRMYLGAHSLNQTIYGSTIGLWILYVFGFVVPKYVDSHVDNIMKGGIAQYRIGFYVVATAFILLQILNIVLYVLLKDSDEFALHQAWVARIDAKCPDSLDSATPFDDSFKGALHTCLYVFMYSTQILSAKKFTQIFEHWYSNIGVLKAILRACIVIIVLGICLIPYFVTTHSSFPVQLCVGIVLSNILIAFVGIPLIDYIAYKFQLVAAPPVLHNERNIATGDPTSDNNRSA